jgi:hypothetical protein
MVKNTKAPPPIYRKEEGTPEEPPRYDRCEFSGRSVSTLMFRGRHFFIEFWEFSWNQIIGINQLLRGAWCWGMGQKPFTLETVRVSKFMKMIVSMAKDGEF